MPYTVNETEPERLARVELSRLAHDNSTFSEDDGGTAKERSVAEIRTMALELLAVADGVESGERVGCVIVGFCTFDREKVELINECKERDITTTGDVVESLIESSRHKGMIVEAGRSTAATILAKRLGLPLMSILPGARVVFEDPNERPPL